MEAPITTTTRVCWGEGRYVRLADERQRGRRGLRWDWSINKVVGQVFCSASLFVIHRVHTEGDAGVVENPMNVIIKIHQSSSSITSIGVE